MINVWLKVLPFFYAGIWGAENAIDPGIRTIGPTSSMVYGGVGDIWRARQGPTSQVEGAFNYAYGWNFLNLRPELTVFVTQGGDALMGVGVNDEYVFKTVSLAPDGSMPVFYSWSAGPSYYSPGSAPNGNLGSGFQFHLINEVGFYVNHSTRVSISYDHYSSGDLTSPNPNSNAFLLNVGCRF